MKKICTVTKTIWLPPIGAALTAYDAKGRIVVVVPVKTDSVSAWLRRPITKAERKRVNGSKGQKP